MFGIKDKVMDMAGAVLGEDAEMKAKLFSLIEKFSSENDIKLPSLSDSSAINDVISLLGNIKNNSLENIGEVNSSILDNVKNSGIYLKLEGLIENIEKNVLKMEIPEKAKEFIMAKLAEIFN